MNKKQFWVWYVNMQIAYKLYITDYPNNFFSNVKKYSFKGNVYKIM